MLLKTKAML